LPSHVHTQFLPDLQAWQPDSSADSESHFPSFKDPDIASIQAPNERADCESKLFSRKSNSKADNVTVINADSKAIKNAKHPAHSTTYNCNSDPSPHV
jgi:hypothetical protein